MNECSQQHHGDPETFSRSSARPLDPAAVQTAVETMRKVAAVSRSLKRVSSAIETVVQTAAGGRDLTLAHWLILVRLSRTRTCRQGDLNSDTGITAGYLTRLLDELEAKGMVHRRRSTEDRRQILLRLTDRGRNAALALLAAIDRYQPLSALDKLQSSLERFLSILASEARG
jgi:DNA-binding MarR family transcriptional regulator